MLCWTRHLEGEEKEDGCPEGERYCAAIAARHKVYFFGHYEKYEKNTKDVKSWQIDVHIFNTVSLGWVKLPPKTPGGGVSRYEVPSMRWGHTAVLIEDTVFIWGECWRGRRGRYYDELFAFDVDAHRWFRPRAYGEVPEGRRNHSACVLEKVMFIFGGSTKRTRYTYDIYKLDTSTMVWSLINSGGTPPSASKGPSATIIGTKMFVLGGIKCNRITVFDTETNCWLSTPARRLTEELMCRSTFTYNGELYIFGGLQQNQSFRPLWKYNPKTSFWKKFEPKGRGPCTMEGMCCCVVGDRIVFFKGPKPRDTPAYDVYILDMSTPSLKTLCELAVIQYGLEQSGLPHNVRWELAAMTK